MYRNRAASLKMTDAEGQRRPDALVAQARARATRAGDRTALAYLAEHHPLPGQKTSVDKWNEAFTTVLKATSARAASRDQCLRDINRLADEQHVSDRARMEATSQCH